MFGVRIRINFFENVFCLVFPVFANQPTRRISQESNADQEYDGGNQAGSQHPTPAVFGIGKNAVDEVGE